MQTEEFQKMTHSEAVLPSRVPLLAFLTTEEVLEHLPLYLPEDQRVCDLVDGPPLLCIREHHLPQLLPVDLSCRV